MSRLSQLKKDEEARRDRCWEPKQRWRVFEDTVSWVESQQAVARNTPASRAAEERRKLRGQRGVLE